MKEYEERAVSLAMNPSKLQDLTSRLKAARLSCPLFDTARWVSRLVLELGYYCPLHLDINRYTFATFFQVKNLERAYFRMWNLYCSGQHPQPFKVAENDLEFPYDR